MLLNASYCFSQKTISKIKFVFTSEGVTTPVAIACTPEDFNWLNDLDHKIIRDSSFISKFAILFDELIPDTSVCFIDARIMSIITYKDQVAKDTLCFGEHHGIDLNGTFMKNDPKLLLLVKKEIWPRDVPDEAREVPDYFELSPEQIEYWLMKNRGYKNDGTLFPQSKMDAYYQLNYEKLDSMLSQKSPMSLKRAVYLVEGAFYNNEFSYEDFNSWLQKYVVFCKELATSQHITYGHQDYKSANTHAVIFKMMTGTITTCINDSTIACHPPIYYKSDDYTGKKKWDSMFVSTLMNKHKGNAHSMPLFYKMVAEELDARAWLSLAPNYFYIRLYNEAIGWYNAELTSGQFPTDTWIKDSGHVHPDAIKSSIYMDTLSLAETVAVCMIDLAEGYLHKYPETYRPTFVLKCCDRALEIFPNYINALLLKAETLMNVYKKNKDKNTYLDAEKLYAHIHRLGYRKVPE